MVLVSILVGADNVRIGLFQFIEASMLVELATLSSLFLLCEIRRFIRNAPHWTERVACALVPAAITGLIIHYLLSDDGVMISLSRLSVFEG